MAAEADHMAVSAYPRCPSTRRRGETLEHAIFDAVVEQLQTVGFAGLTMEGVAGCAHTGKAALYRRWPCKEDLVVDSLHHTLPSLADLPDHGNTRDDLLDLLRRVAAMVNSPTGCALQSLMAEIDRDRPFARIVHERVLEPRKRMFLTVLRRGVDRGEVRPDAASLLVAEVGPAMVVQRFLVDGAPVSDAYVEAVVDDLVMPLLRPSRST